MRGPGIHVDARPAQCYRDDALSRVFEPLHGDLFGVQYGSMIAHELSTDELLVPPTLSMDRERRIDESAAIATGRLGLGVEEAGT